MATAIRTLFEVSVGNRLEVYGSRFVGTKIGHHVKSLAETTIVKGNHFDDAGAGRATASTHRKAAR
ncbi:MAG: hypothetical protein R3C54_01115 [Parvularculaceae bacterium]